jgi:uncharacterized SAM-binding protein YcdF (DUF218 family)
MHPGDLAITFLRTLLLPPFSLFLFYGIGLLLGKRSYGRLLRGGSVALLFLLCTQAGAWLLMRPLENLAVPFKSAGNAQAIVVLGAGRLRNAPEYSGRDIPDYIALARLRYATKLHRETALPVLASGGAASSKAGVVPLAYGMRRALQEDFATPVKWTEDKSYNTAENAEYSAQILKQSGIQRIVLVTDAMHMYRARIAFEKQGLDVIAAPTMFLAQGKLTLMDLLPDAEGLRRANYALYEWLGIVWYHLRY